MSSNIWALLIGIDCYMGRTINGLPNYRSLRGCVNDVLLMDDLLRTRFSVPDTQITKLLATGIGSQPEGPATQWPTKANIVAAFEKLAQTAKAGDQIYIHYSGHGGRAITIDSKLKGDGGLDECIVPTDYGQIENKEKPEDRYLRDIEMARLLQNLVDKKLVVTIVLDSCHSGGATRGGDDRGNGEIAARGCDEIDMIQRTPSKLVASRKALRATWQARGGETRSSGLPADWLPNPDDYTFLSGCRALELSSETLMPTGKRHGYLTYWLWDTLQKPQINWGMAYQQIHARVYGANPSQSPQLQGTRDRAIFGGATLTLPVGVNVLKVEGEHIRLDIGKSGGVDVGAQFFLYPPGTKDFKATEQRLAVAEVISSEDTKSMAKIIRQLSNKTVDPGAQAILFSPGSSQQRSVRMKAKEATPSDIEQKAFAKLEKALSEFPEHFVRMAKANEAAHFQIRITEQNAYQICGVNGQPLPNLQPVAIADETAIPEMLYELTHLAKYFNAQALANPDPNSRLAGKLAVTLLDTSGKPLSGSGGIPTVTPDQKYHLQIRNLFDKMEQPPSDSPAYLAEMRRRTMNISVLNLAPEWSITRIIPAPLSADSFIELPPGETLMFKRKDQPVLPVIQSSLAALGDTVNEADDIIAVFATTEPADSYDALQLPALYDLSKRATVLNDAEAQEPEINWCAVQVRVRVVKKQ